MRIALYVFFALMAVAALVVGIFAPPPLAILLFCALAWLTPAYWIAGVIYARDAGRAFFVGGLAAGTVPFLALTWFSLTMLPNFGGSFGYSGRRFGDAQSANLIAALYIFSPVVLSFLGGWLATAVYYSVQPQEMAIPPASPFREMIPVALPQPRPGGERKQF